MEDYFTALYFTLLSLYFTLLYFTLLYFTSLHFTLLFMHLVTKLNTHVKCPILLSDIKQDWNKLTNFNTLFRNHNS